MFALPGQSILTRRARGLIVGAAVAAPSSLTYLPVTATPPNLVAGVRKAVAAYGGPAVRIQKSATDTAQVDVPFGPDGWIDPSAVLAFTGGATIDGTLVAKIYDQTGAGNDPATTNANRMPSLAINVDGNPTISFDNDELIVPTSYTGAIRSFSAFFAMRYGGGSIFQLGATTRYGGLGVDTTTARLSYGGRNATFAQYGNYSAISVVSSSSGINLSQDASTSALSVASSSGSGSGALIGNSATASTNLGGSITLLAFYGTALSVADAAAVRGFMQALTGGGVRNRVLVLGEDSLTAGTGSTNGKDRAFFIERAIGASVKIYSKGKGGRTMATFSGSDFASAIAPYDPSAVANVMAVLGGTNDIIQGYPISPESDGTSPSLQYSTRSVAAQAAAAGFAFVAYNLPVSAADGAKRTEFNSWLDANSPSFAVAKIDLRTSSIGGGQVANGQFYSDSTHPNTRGYEEWTKTEIPVLKGPLGLPA